MNKEVDFIIVGGMKSGTSSLRNYLGKLPGFRLLPAEGSFFNNDLEYSKGLDYYLKRFGTEDDVKNLRLGEKTVDYSYHPLVPERIKKAFPEIKLIWILRDPVTRTYSNYLHEFKRGMEWLSFDKALQRELNRQATSKLHTYIEKSKYSIQIERYLKYFPIHQILFLSFEELKSLPLKTMGQLHEFLEIKGVSAEIEYVAANKTILPRFPTLNRMAKKIIPEKSKWNIPIDIINFYKVKPGYPLLTSEQVIYLEELFCSEKDWMDRNLPEISKNWKRK